MIECNQQIIHKGKNLYGKQKNQKLFMCFLCFVFASFCVAAVAAVNVENARAEGAATTENIKEYTVGAVSVHHLSTNGKVYAMFVDEEGN